MANFSIKNANEEKNDVKKEKQIYIEVFYYIDCVAMETGKRINELNALNYEVQIVTDMHFCCYKSTKIAFQLACKMC